MKLNTLFVSAGFLTLSSLASAAVSFTGNAFSNAPGIAVGDVGVLIFDNNPSDGEGFSNISFKVGDSLISNSTYGNFTVATNNGSATSKTAVLFGSNINLSGSFAQIDISISSISTVNQGDTFAWVVFQNSTTTVLAGDTYTIYTDASWVVPPDGNYGFSATVNAGAGNPFQQVNATTAAGMIVKTGTVASAVPEPSTYAAVVGLLALGAVASKRKRSA